MKPLGLRRLAAIFGLLVTAAMMFVKLVPFVPGHFRWHEWMALAIWAGLGIAVRSSHQKQSSDEPSVEMAGSTG